MCFTATLITTNTTVQRIHQNCSKRLNLILGVVQQKPKPSFSVTENHIKENKTATNRKKWLGTDFGEKNLNASFYGICGPGLRAGALSPVINNFKLQDCDKGFGCVLVPLFSILYQQNQ